jgi:hypothetical protein
MSENYRQYEEVRAMLDKVTAERDALQTQFLIVTDILAQVVLKLRLRDKFTWEDYDEFIDIPDEIIKTFDISFERAKEQREVDREAEADYYESCREDEMQEQWEKDQLDEHEENKDRVRGQAYEPAEEDERRKQRLDQSLATLRKHWAENPD